MQQSRLGPIDLCDRGYRGKKRIGRTEIIIPTSSPKSTDPNYEKTKQRKRFPKCAEIEGVIGHLKADHRLGRNFLSGFWANQINLLMAAAAFNFRKWLREFYFLLKVLLKKIHFLYGIELIPLNFYRYCVFQGQLNILLI